jgi:intracellular septation protein A
MMLELYFDVKKYVLWKLIVYELYTAIFLNSTWLYSENMVHSVFNFLATDYSVLFHSS